MKARELWEWDTDIWQPAWGGGPSVHTLVRSCPHLPHPKSCPTPGLGYWAGWALDPAVAPFSWGVLDMRKKVVLMAWWQLSMSVGTSATVRPLVGMASSTSTLMVAVGGGGHQQPGGLGAPPVLLPWPQRCSLSSQLNPLPSPSATDQASPRSPKRPARLAFSLDTPASGDWLLAENNLHNHHSSYVHTQ